jgi:hypothetical protein
MFYSFGACSAVVAGLAALGFSFSAAKVSEKLRVPACLLPSVCMQTPGVGYACMYIHTRAHTHILTHSCVQASQHVANIGKQSRHCACTHTYSPIPRQTWSSLIFATNGCVAMQIDGASASLTRTRAHGHKLTRGLRELTISSETGLQ